MQQAPPPLQFLEITIQILFKSAESDLGLTTMFLEWLWLMIVSCGFATKKHNPLFQTKEEVLQIETM